MPDTSPNSDNGKAVAAAGRSCVCFNVRKAARTITQYYDDCLKPSGLRATQYGLLMTIKTSAPVNVKRLAGVAAMDRTTLSRNLKPLERQGLVRIDSGSDRRERRVTLTEAGRASVRCAYSLWAEAQARVVERFGPERWMALMGELNELSALVRG
jgi:DNA-binding MarR family transcriptional regulator